MLLVKRMRERAIVFAALLAVTAVASGLMVGIVGYLSTAEADGVRSQLAERSGADVALELALTTQPDVAAQDTRVRDLLARVFRDGDRMLELAVTRSTISTNPVQLSTGVKAFVASIPDLDSNAELLSGAWPRSPGEASLQADAAEGLGLAPGDELTVGDTEVTITGTWRLSDPHDPRWVSDPLLLRGIDSAVRGPIVVAESDLPAIGAATTTRWAIVPDVAALRAGDLDIFIQNWRTIADSMREDRGFNVDSLQRSGRFAAVATSIQSTVNALGAVAPVALLVIGAIALLTLTELGRVLVTLRSREHLLLWSRGDTVVGLTLAAAAEAGIVALAGAAVGGAAGVLAVRLPLDLLGPAVLTLPTAVALLATLAFAVTAFTATRSIARGVAPEEGGRAARISGIAAPAFLSLAAALSTWQLLLYGSPVTPSRDGGTQVDPIAVLAPALVLLALVSLALAAAPLAARPLDRLSARSTGTALVTRTLARRTRLLAAPLVLCALAAGQITLAAGYAQTWDTAYTATAALRAGSELIVVDSQAPLSPGVLADVSGASGVSAVASVYSEEVVVGETPASMIAATPAALLALASRAGGVFDAAGAAEKISTPLNGPVLPASTREVTITVAANSTVPVDLALLVADEFGVQQELVATGTYSVEIPGTHGELRVLALIVGLPDNGPTSLSVTGMTADGTDVDLAGSWSAAGFDPLLVEVTPTPTGAGFRDADGLRSVRITPSLGFSSDDIHPPVLVSSALAQAARINVGDVVPISLDPRFDTFGCVVAGIIPAVPGARSESGVLVDGSVIEAIRARLYRETPTPQIAWVGAADPGSSWQALRETVPAGVSVRALAVDENRSILGSAAVALWLGAAGAGILTLLALIAGAGAQLRSRRGEVFVLRALGISDRQLAAGRRRELGIAIAVGIGVGVVAGVVVTALTLAALARAAVPDSYEALPIAVALHPLGLALGLTALTLTCAVIVAAYGRRVTR